MPESATTAEPSIPFQRRQKTVSRVALVPPAVTVLRDATDVKWGRVVGVGDAKVLWPNTLQRFGVPDLRGYESIVPEWTARALSAAEDQSGWLQFNRIGNLTDADLLGHRTYEPGSDTHAAVVAAFGQELVAQDGSIDRKVLELETRVAELVNLIESLKRASETAPVAAIATGEIQQ